MQTRFRVFMGATALLYLGPLLAGMGRAGWGAVLAFTVVFILWLVVLRPSQWPRSLAEWRTGPAIIQGLTQALMQLVLVTLLFAFGRAIGGALGLRPDWPGYLPIALSFLAIPLGRLIWDPSKAETAERIMDREGPTEALAMVDAMPRDLPPDQIAQHLQAMAAHLGAPALWQALQSPGDDHRLRAMVVFATDARAIGAIAGQLPSRALDALGDRSDLVALWAQRGAVALDQNGGLWGQFPDAERIAVRLTAMAGSQAEAPLRGLIEVLDRSTQGQG